MTAEPALPLDEVVARKVQAKRKVRFMTAAFYLGEMLVREPCSPSPCWWLRIVRMSADAARCSAAGIVAWTQAEYLVDRFELSRSHYNPTRPASRPPRTPYSQSFGRYGLWRAGRPDRRRQPYPAGGLVAYSGICPGSIARTTARSNHCVRDRRVLPEHLAIDRVPLIIRPRDCGASTTLGIPLAGTGLRQRSCHAFGRIAAGSADSF